MKADITLSVPIEETPRLEQVRGLFDLRAEEHSTFKIQADLPVEERPWSIGLITGPSGSGKSTVARHLWPMPSQRKIGQDCLWQADLDSWPERQAVIDGFPDLPWSIKDTTDILGSVGFNDSLAWLRPYRCLSTGQQFRCDLARLLAFGDQAQRPQQPSQSRPGVLLKAPVLIFDEYTSVVDRTVAQIGSAAVAKTVRGRGLKFVAVTCHEDVLDWLQPDWVFYPDTGVFNWRSVQRRPRLYLEISRCTASSWRLFAPHHYLSAGLAKSATCWLAWLRWGGQLKPVAFSAWLPQPILGKHVADRREHRTVVLPDFQGVGIGMALSDTLASMWAGLGLVARSTTSHPAFSRARSKSKSWRLVTPPRVPRSPPARRSEVSRKITPFHCRFTSGWEYVGKPMNRETARKLFDG